MDESSVTSADRLLAGEMGRSFGGRGPGSKSSNGQVNCLTWIQILLKMHSLQLTLSKIQVLVCKISQVYYKFNFC